MLAQKLAVIVVVLKFLLAQWRLPFERCPLGIGFTEKFSEQNSFPNRNDYFICLSWLGLFSWVRNLLIGKLDQSMICKNRQGAVTPF